MKQIFSILWQMIQILHMHDLSFPKINLLPSKAKLQKKKRHFSLLDAYLTWKNNHKNAQLAN